MKETFSLNSNFSLTTNEDGTKEIKGFAIHGGEDFIVNGFYEIPESELKNCAKTLKGAKLMKNHDTFNVDSIIGRVNAAEVTFDIKADMQGVKYEASLVVDDTRLAEKIDKGLIDATSIGFSFEPECSICGNPFFSEECTHSPWFDDMHFICRDMDIHELSLIPFGADPHASVSGFSAEDTDKIREKFAKQKEEFIMSKEDNIVETLKSENLELSQKVSDLEAQLEQKEADFQKEKDTLENEYQGEVLTLQQEKKALDDKIKAMQQELSAFRAEAEAKLAKALEEKKARLMELAEKYDAVDLLREDMTEEYIDENIAMLERVEAKVGEPKQTPQKFNGAEQPHQTQQTEKEHVPFSGISNAFHIAHKKINAQKGD